MKNTKLGNMEHVLFIALVFMLHTQSPKDKGSDTCARPFPQHTPYKAGLWNAPPISDEEVIFFYDRLKTYFQRDPVSGGMFMANDEKGEQADNLTTSEANGYGMIILALMAGHDPEAHAKFDSMYAFATNYHCEASPLLMRWRVSVNRKKKDKDNSDTAIDGDLDMAYALLLAARQWKKTEKYDYYQLACQTLDEILRLEVDQKGLQLLRGSAAADEPGSWTYNTIRLSDFMPDHFRAFYQCTHKKIWLDLLTRYENLYAAVQKKLSPKYGLFPEYLIVNGNDFQLVPDNISRNELGKEGIDDGGRKNEYGRMYGYNSCRVPWRLATDYFIHGDQDSSGRDILRRISEGMRLYTHSDACRLTDVFPLDFSDQKAHDKWLLDGEKNHSADLNVIGPVYLASFLDKGSPEWQYWLKKQLLNDDPMPCAINNGNAERDYYENTLRVLFLLLLSNNYWSPAS